MMGRETEDEQEEESSHDVVVAAQPWWVSLVAQGQQADDELGGQGPQIHPGQGLL